MDYKELLKKAQKEMPKTVFEKQRFEIPKVRGHIQGNKTVISNIFEIINKLRCKPEHLLKYLQKELATSGEIKKSGAVIFNTKLPASRINEKIKQYAYEFVLCPECGKPDTHIIKEEGITYIKCTACGAKHPVKSRI